jgi:hypothetical protein
MGRRGELADRALGAIGAPAFPLYAGLAALYVVARAGTFANVAVTVTDTPSYEETAAHPLWSVGFLGGVRPFTVPLLYKAITTADGRIVAQLVISTLCWLALAASVARSVQHPLLQPVAFTVPLAMSLTRDVFIWDVLLLSESLTFALMALLVAAWLWLVRHPTPARAAVVLMVLLLWTFTRDSNAYVVLAVAVLVALSLVDQRHRRMKLALLAGCVSIFGAGVASAEAGKRWLLPVKDVVFRRVIETPEMSRYFARHGLTTEGNWTLTPWLEQARGVYVGYLLRHPGYVLTAPFHGRQEALYSTPDNLKSLLQPDLANYDTNSGLGFMRSPQELGPIFFPRRFDVLFALLGASVALAALVAARAGPETVWIVPVGILLTTYPHLLAVWHFSGYEVDRHALQAGLLLRLAAFLLLLFAVDRVLPHHPRPGRE